MQTQHAVNTKSTKPEKSTATEAPGAIKLEPLREAIRELETAARRVKDLQEAYTDLLATVAQKSGIGGSVIRSFVAARIAEDDRARARKRSRAEQLALLFDEVGA